MGNCGRVLKSVDADGWPVDDDGAAGRSLPAKDTALGSTAPPLSGRIRTYP